MREVGAKKQYSSETTDNIPIVVSLVDALRREVHRFEAAINGSFNW
jgi:hypothetical protein